MRRIVAAIALALIGTLLPLAAPRPAEAVEIRPLYSVADLTRQAVAALDAVTYRIRTTLATPDGDVVRNHTGIVQLTLPLGLEVDLFNRVDVGDGDANADLDADVWVNPLDLQRVEIDMRRVGAELPLRVELIFDLPDGVNGALFGYDARASFNPGRLDTFVSFAGSGARSSVDATARAAGVPPEVTLLAELFARGPGASREDPTRAAVTLAPVPTRLGFGLDTDETSGSTDVTLESSHATVATVDATDIKGARTRTLNAMIEKLPTSAQVTAVSTPGGDSIDVDYVASDAVALVEAIATDTVADSTTSRISAEAEAVPAEFHIDARTVAGVVASGGPPEPQEVTTVDYAATAELERLDIDLQRTAAGEGSSNAVVELTDVPTEVNATLTTVGSDDTTTELDDRSREIVVSAGPEGAGSAVGEVEFGLATDADDTDGTPPTVELLDPTPFFDDGDLAAGERPGYVFDDGFDDSIAARLSGLRTATVRIGKPVLDDDDVRRPIAAHVEADPQAVLVHQDNRDGRLEATILRSPDSVDFSVVPAPGGELTATYGASGPIERSEVFAQVDDPDAPFSTVDVHIDDIPAALIVSTREGEIVADAPDVGGTPERDRVGAIEALLTEERRTTPAGDGTLESFITDATHRLVSGDDGAVVDVVDTSTLPGLQLSTTVYARVHGLTGLTLSNPKPALEAIDAPDDRQSFQDEAPMPIADVPTVAAERLATETTARVVRVALEPDSSLAPLGFRHHSVRGDGAGGFEPTYVEARLETPPESVELTLRGERKRIDGDTPCDLGSGAGCDEFDESCIVVAGFCEEAFSLDYHASAGSGPLTLNTNSGDRENLFLTAPSLPGDVEVCAATDGTCTDHAAGFAVTSMSVRLMASEPMQLEIHDCIEDRESTDPPCGRDGVGLDDEANLLLADDDDRQYISGVLSSVRFLEVEASPPPVENPAPGEGDLVGSLFITTTGRRPADPSIGREADPDGEHPIAGQVKVRSLAFDPSCDETREDAGRQRMRLTFSDASANLRSVPMVPEGGCAAVTGVSVLGGGTGSMTCPIFTEIDLAPNLDAVLFFGDVGELSGELCVP